MIDPVRETHHCTCRRCCKDFCIVSTIGPSLICDECADKLLAIIHGGKVTGRDRFGSIIIDQGR